MRPGPATHAGRILALLELGGWWSTQDLLTAVPSIVHSRVSDLRAKGYVIQHKTTGTGARHSLYRLTGFNGVAPSAGDMEPSPAEGGAATESAPTASSSPPVEGEPVDNQKSSAAKGSPSQLALELPGRLHERAA